MHLLHSHWCVAAGAKPAQACCSGNHRKVPGGISKVQDECGESELTIEPPTAPQKPEHPHNDVKILATLFFVLFCYCFDGGGGGGGSGSRDWT